MKPSPVFKLQDRFLEIEANNQKKLYELRKLPDDFINWHISERIKLFNILKNKKQPDFFNPHLPTLLTINNDKIDFSINAASKGVGLVPDEKVLGKINMKVQNIIKHIDKGDFFESVQKRIDGAMLLYGDQKKINPFCLGGLEIFETKSYENLLKNPFVSLFYVGVSPTYKSYQINCIAEIIQKNHPFYKFIINMRSLFEEASFHYQQPKYPFAVKYHIVEVLDKSLKIRNK